jgi:hypothetical protein
MVGKYPDLAWSTFSPAESLKARAAITVGWLRTAFSVASASESAKAGAVAQPTSPQHAADARKFIDFMNNSPKKIPLAQTYYSPNIDKKNLSRQ